jgi:hypothetical protein
MCNIGQENRIHPSGVRHKTGAVRPQHVTQLIKFFLQHSTSMAFPAMLVETGHVAFMEIPATFQDTDASCLYTCAILKRRNRPNRRALEDFEGAGAPIAKVKLHFALKFARKRWANEKPPKRMDALEELKKQNNKTPHGSLCIK